MGRRAFKLGPASQREETENRHEGSAVSWMDDYGDLGTDYSGRKCSRFPPLQSQHLNCLLVIRSPSTRLYLPVAGSEPRRWGEECDGSFIENGGYF